MPAVARAHCLAHEHCSRGSDEQGVHRVKTAEHRRRSGTDDAKNELQDHQAKQRHAHPRRPRRPAPHQRDDHQYECEHDERGAKKPVGREVVVAELLVMNGGERAEAGEEELNDKEDAEQVREDAVKGAKALHEPPTVSRSLLGVSLGWVGQLGRPYHCGGDRVKRSEDSVSVARTCRDRQTAIAAPCFDVGPAFLRFFCGRRRRQVRGLVIRLREMRALTPAPRYQDIIVETGGGRATVTINRPARLNALRTTTVRELCRALSEASDDPQVGVLVLTGAGERAFCVGGDVREPTQGEREKREQVRLYLELGELLRGCGVPVLLRVRGYCIGAGHEINVLADLTISGTSGVFGQAGTRLGWAPVWWAAQALTRMVGDKRARELVYLSRRYTADEGLRMGLVNVVVPDDCLDDEVDRWCEEILRSSPEALRLAKIGLNAGSDASRGSILPSIEANVLNHLYGPDPAEGIRAFQEGRPADWRPQRNGAGPVPEAD
jgi:1,4-dihydroxy-2-naphthoyl-CoA synthase